MRVRLHGQYLESDAVHIAEAAAVPRPVPRCRMQAVIHVHRLKAEGPGFGHSGQEVQEHHRIRAAAVGDADSGRIE